MKITQIFTKIKDALTPAEGRIEYIRGSNGVFIRKRWWSNQGTDPLDIFIQIRRDTGKDVLREIYEKEILTGEFDKHAIRIHPEAGEIVYPKNRVGDDSHASGDSPHSNLPPEDHLDR